MMDWGSAAAATAQIAGSLFGGGDDAEKQWRDQASVNWNMQREFLQNQLQWRASDAKAAGFHPTAALGLPAAQGSPVAIGGGYDGPSLGERLADSGAGLARSVLAKQTESERLQERLLAAQIDGQEIENAYKRSQLVLSSGSQLPPAQPSSSFDDGRRVPMYSTVMTPSGPRRMASDDYAQRLENDPSEFLRYLPRDLADRAGRLGSSIGDFISTYPDWFRSMRKRHAYNR